MKLIGKNITATTKAVILTLEIDPFDYREAHSTNSLIRNGDDIEIKVKRQKRSLNANSYYWLLINKIATAIKSTSTEVHNKMLRDYGVEWTDANGNRMFVQLPEAIEYQREERLHVKPTARVTENANGCKYRTFVLLKPSHMYDTKEFSRLLDGAIYEAKILGIETESEDWIERIKNTWKPVN